MTAIAARVPLQPPFACYLHGPQDPVVAVVLTVFSMKPPSRIPDVQAPVGDGPASVTFNHRDDLIAFLAFCEAYTQNVDPVRLSLSASAPQAK